MTLPGRLPETMVKRLFRNHSPVTIQLGYFVHICIILNEPHENKFWEFEMSAPVSKALPVLRFGLALFMLLWAVNKLITPAAHQGVFEGFYGLSLGASPVIVLGVVQIAILLAFAAGVARTVTYGLVLAMNLVTLIVAAKPIIFAFSDGGNLLFAASIPVLGASLVLFLLRDHDTWLTLSPAPQAV